MNKETQQQCKVCKKQKQLTSFYSTISKFYPSGRLDVCKTCLKNMVDIEDIESLKLVLRQVDKPYIQTVWNKSLKDNEENPVGDYWRIISSLPQYRGLTWADSVFSEEENSKAPVNLTQSHSQGNAPSNRESVVKPPVDAPPELFDKWGYDFTPQEVIAFENLFNDLKNNYKLPTASHVEFLKLACISRVKAVNAMSKGETKEAKDYMAIFKDMTNAGKLQPAQFSKSDLSEGLDTFSELVRQVEKTVDIIQILPRFKERPQDKVDLVIWANANYVRNLKGLEEASYEEIWKFYDVRKKDYEAAMSSTQQGDDIDG